MPTLIHTRRSLNGTAYTVRLSDGQTVTIDMPESYTWEDVEYLAVFLRSLPAGSGDGTEERDHG